MPHTDAGRRYLHHKVIATAAIIEATVGAIRGGEAGEGVQAALTRAGAHGGAAAELAAGPASTALAVTLQQRVGLTTSEVETLWILVAFALDPQTRILVRSLGDGTADPTADVLRRLVHGAVAPRDGWAELGEERPLRRLGLVERTDSGPADVPPYRQAFAISGRLLDLLHGDDALPARLTSACRRVTTPDATPWVEVVVAEVAAVIARAGRRLSLLQGEAASGRGEALIDAFIREGRGVLEVRCRALPATASELKETLRAVAREARLGDLVVVLRDLDAITSIAGTLGLIEATLLEGGATVTATSRGPVHHRWSTPPLVMTLPKVTAARRQALWAAALPGLHQDDAAHLAMSYPLAPALIAEAGRGAVEAGSIDADRIIGGVRAVVRNQLGDLATRVDVRQQWQDLVLPPDQLGMIDELTARIRQRGRVYEDWGFADKLGRGLGVAALFSGPPGTGKTMVAGLIARELGLELYQVDLAKIVSKWLGETEKQLAALFDAAEASCAMLLFDEADSLFAKRTEVRSSNDRHANLEVNFLLQRLESFTGVCILTSNHDSAIDDAFRRRLSAHVRFPMPEATERAALWQALLPGQAPVEDGIRFASLGERFAMSGGHIRNAVLRAAFLAADRGEHIGERHLLEGGHIEYESLGRVVSGRRAA